MTSTKDDEVGRDHDEALLEQKNRGMLAANRRLRAARMLGGLRAVDTFTESRFEVTEKNRAAFTAAASFDMTTNLYLHGPTGSGKSRLAAIAARRHLGYSGPFSGDPVATLTQMELSRALRNCDGAAQEEAALSEFQTRPVLVVDDLGIAKDTEFLLSLIYEVVNWRYMNMPGGLIVTSNLGLGDLARKFGDDRISSRLAQMCRVFSLAGEKDMRLERRQK